METDAKNLQNKKNCYLYLLSGDLVGITKYCLEKLRRFTKQKMLKRKRGIGRTYGSGNEKKEDKSSEGK